jgi:erythromycin esterase-like protein
MAITEQGGEGAMQALRGLFGGEDRQPEALVSRIAALARPLEQPSDLDPLIERIGDSRFVLLGEASHGTSEYYTWRAQLSQRLIKEKGFSFVAVEGDWPDCYQVNRYIKGAPNSGESAQAVLHAFDRWPTWMWANREVVRFAEWLRRYNDGAETGTPLPEDRKAGFYGLDVYSLWDSMQAVITYLEQVDPEAVDIAKRVYGCFDPYGQDEQEYARATLYIPKGCQDAVVSILGELYRRAPQYEEEGREAFFNAEQNALVAKNAERYYRTMARGGPSSWNIRDTHMTDTLDRLMEFHGPASKAIVWEHNTHVGDARATDMARDGMVNVGQLVRERHAGEGVVLVGFGSYRGSVIASGAWGAPMERKHVPQAAEDSYEDLMHRAGIASGVRNQLLLFPDTDAGQPEAALWSVPRGHRAIGVVYNSAFERYGNYVPTVLPQRYDAFLFLDETTALHPLHMASRPDEVPETYPFGV